MTAVEMVSASKENADASSRLLGLIAQKKPATKIATTMDTAITEPVFANLDSPVNSAN